jgi:hypothetical protein
MHQGNLFILKSQFVISKQLIFLLKVTNCDLKMKRTISFISGAVRMDKDVALVPPERIERSILLIRGQKVMLDRDLAQLYGVETRALNQAVRRNIDRFPEDFMFRLTREEIMRISQFVISSVHPGVKTLKFSKNVMAFTEHGVAMLSEVV